MPAAPWMPFYIGDYMADTMHLTTEQHGAYLLLLFACWTHGGQLPNNDSELAAITRLPIEEWKEVRKKLAPFFKISVKFLRQKRVAVELERAQHLHEVRSKAGSKGGSKTKARARVPQPQPQRREVGEAAKAKPESSKSESEPLSQAAAREESGFTNGKGNSLGRSAPLAAAPPLKAKKKELLRNKLLRYADAKFGGAERTAAFAGLSGADAEHSEQWWLDHLDIRMRADRWDDTR